ncbi:MAG: CPBP family intramembrane glutamic endopeptidase [Leptospiraceae bacterium]|nr:CPBP family intramembrane glutamic endopeptidase [Leptospiraceae bacterium]
MKHLIFLFFIFPLIPVISQEKYPPQNKKDPYLAASLGIVPGLGQAYLGNTTDGGIQLGTFISFYSLRQHFLSQPDYIRFEERQVKFDFKDALFGYGMQRNGLVYNDLPIFSETNFDRTSRLLKEGQLAEQNPLIKYGEYSRTSRSSVYSDMLANPVISVMMYSVYSSFRDGGGLGTEKKNETLLEISLSPFQPSILKKEMVYIPLLIFGGLLGLDSLNPSSENPILTPSSVKRDGSLYLSAFATGISPAIGEEAFFRGYMNYNLTRTYGTNVGIFASGSIFMLAHEGNSDAAEGRLSRLLAGLYLGYVHVMNGYDIKPGVALHFWYNFFIGLSEISRHKSDPNYDKSQRDVYYMPIQFTLAL